MDNRCVCCGEIIPEGRQVCPNCDKGKIMANEKRLIDADLFVGSIEFVQKHLVCGDSYFLQGYEAGLRGAVNAINEIPTVDAVEVVHSEWDMDEFGVFCPVCKEYAVENERTNYCPNCGAKMDGERRNDGKIDA